jgi:hypothetical protein
LDDFSSNDLYLRSVHMTNHRRISILVAIMLIITVVFPGFAGMNGTGVTGVQVQNLSTSSSASVAVQLWNQSGGSPIVLDSATIPQSAAQNFYLPNYGAVPSGSYAMLVSSSQPAAAIVRTDWSAVGGAAIYNSVAPATDVIIPLITKDFAGQTSQLSVQNTNTSDSISDVVLTLYGRGSSTPIVTSSPQTIGAGTSKTWDMDDPLWGTLPDNALDLGSTGFVGALQVTSSTDLAVQSFIDIPGTPGVTGFNGIPSDSAAMTLYCPLIRANYYGDTGISIVNLNSLSADVTITFRADAGSPHSGVYTQDITVPGNSSSIAFQGPGGNSRQAPTNLPGGSQTGGNPTPTNDGFYGVATITSNRDVLAVANDTLFGSGWSVQAQSSYNCMTDAEAGTDFALPLVRKYHLADTKLTTGIQIQNVSGSSVTVSLDLTNWDGTSQSSSNPTPIVIPAYGSGNFWNGFLTGLPTVPPSYGGSGWFGSAILSATGGNVVVVVSDEGYGTTAVDSANYNGLLMP